MVIITVRKISPVTYNFAYKPERVPLL